MSKLALTWLRRQQIADASVRRVLEELARHHFAGQPLFPSQRGIADRTNLSPRTVWSALRLLEHFGLITRVARLHFGKGRTSDTILLSFSRDFTITRDAIRVARKALSPPSQNLRDPLAKSAKENQSTNTIEPIQETDGPKSNTLGAEQDGGGPWLGFAVIAGGRK